MAADRRVTHTGKDRDGDITKLCNLPVWGSVGKQRAILDIESGRNRYYVLGVNDVIIWIRVITTRQGNKYLRTDPDRTTTNNLDYLPDC